MILITGGSGQLGNSLQKKLQDMSEKLLAPAHSELDITDRGQVDAFFRQKHPEVVLHCAAFNRVDDAQIQPALCCRTNITGTENIARACRRTGAWLLYTSSDYVFDGTKQGAYETTDRKHPLSVYGYTKSRAEDLVLEYDARNTVLRLSWLFGIMGDNFVESVLRAARGKKEIPVVSDQIGSPTYAEDLAELILTMVQRRPCGIFQASNEGVCSRAQFAERILRLAGSDTVVREVSGAEYPSKAQRPGNSVLSKSSLDAAGISRMPLWTDALARYFKQRKEMWISCP